MLLPSINYLVFPMAQAFTWPELRSHIFSMECCQCQDCTCAHSEPLQEGEAHAGSRASGWNPVATSRQWQYHSHLGKLSSVRLGAELDWIRRKDGRGRRRVRGETERRGREEGWGSRSRCDPARPVPVPSPSYESWPRCKVPGGQKKEKICDEDTYSKDPQSVIVNEADHCLCNFLSTEQGKRVFMLLKTNLTWKRMNKTL